MTIRKPNVLSGLLLTTVSVGLTACGRATLAALACLAVTACGVQMDSFSISKAEEQEPFEDAPVPRAECGPGSVPETGMQGQVPLADRQSGRSQEPYSCNLEVVAQYQGEGATWSHAWYDDCAYYGQTWPGAMGPPRNPGTVVIDAADPANVRRTATLDSAAMLDPHESLKVNERRALLGAVNGWDPAGDGLLYFDVYDVSKDCTQPRLMASAPITQGIGHEGNWAPDGLTYYGAFFWIAQTADITQPPQAAGIHAIDVADPSLPKLLLNFHSTHGLSVSEDGNRLYTSRMDILDVSEIQARKPSPTFSVVGRFPDATCSQHTIPVTIGGQPYAICVSESISNPGATVSIVNISDETAPTLAARLQLEIHMPDAVAEANAGNGIFPYSSHYCYVDQLIEPTALGCGYMQSGIRVFDIRNPYRPKEIAYYIPPGQVGKNAELLGSDHANSAVAWTNGGPAVGSQAGYGQPNLTADWCSSQVRLVKERGEIWTTCQDNGFLILRFTNGVWPFKD